MSVAADWIERAGERDLRAVAEQLLGRPLKKAAASEYVGPCPACRDGDDRFGVNVKMHLWHCRHCGKGGDVIALVMHVEGVGFREAVERLAGETSLIIRPAPHRPRILDPDERACRQHEKARWLWAQRKPLAGSIAETYLREVRGYGGSLPATLGFLSTFKDHPPSLIAAFGLPDEPEPAVLVEPLDVKSVQLTALRPDGSGKADVEIKKRTIGAHKGLPIVASPPNDLLGLSIHEGVEDALSAYEATNLGCWASGGAPFLPDLADAVPSYIETVTIVSHQDRAGQIGARELARRLTEKGVEVFLKEEGGDG